MNENPLPQCHEETSVVALPHDKPAALVALENYLSAKGRAKATADALLVARHALVSALGGQPPAGTQKTHAVENYRVTVKTPATTRVVGDAAAVVALRQHFADNPSACPIREKIELVAVAAACEELREKDPQFFAAHVAPLLEFRPGAVQVEVRQ